MFGMSEPARILITGVAGFVGGYLLTECHTRYPEAEVFGLLQHPLPAGGTPQAAPSGYSPIVGDVVDAGQMRAAIATARPDLVFHLAALPSVAASWSDPVQALAVNAGGTVHLLEALRAERLNPRVLLVGSGEQYGHVRPEENPINEDCLPRPANPYAVSKVAQDLYGYQYFAAFGMPIIRVRPFNHFGSHQNEAFVVSSFARQIALIESAQAEPVLLVGNLDAQRDFLPVEDVARAYIFVADSGHPGMAYNIGSGQARSIRHILEALLSLASVPIEIRTDPARLRPADVPLLVADTSRVREHTGWQPVYDISGALQRTLDYWRHTVAGSRISS